MSNNVKIIILCFFIMSVRFTIASYAQTPNKRVIYEEPTSFKDAKHRKKIISSMQESKPPEQINAGSDQPAQKAWLEKMMPLLEKFFGIKFGDAATNEPNDTQLKASEKSKFKQSPEKHNWKSLRRMETNSEFGK